MEVGVERPVVLGLDPHHVPTDAQRKAIDFLANGIEEVGNFDGNLPAEALERQALGLGTRALALFADRGMGKTSVLLTVARKCRDLDKVPLWPPVDARALDSSDSVMAAILARLAGAATADLRADAQAERRAWVDIQQSAWKSHSMYARFVASTAASAPEFGAYLIERSRGTERLRADLERATEQWLSRVQKTQCVIFIDDLDQSQGRALEALIDIEKFLCAPGLVFIFTFKYDSLWHDIASGLFAHLPGTLRGLETDSFLRKTLPADRRIDLWALAREKRLAFRAEGGTVQEFLDSAIPALGRHLFPRSGSDQPMEFVHADLLPSTPRGLRALCASLRGVRNTAASDTNRLLDVVQRLAKAQDAFPVFRLLDRVVDTGEQPDRLAVRIIQHLPLGSDDASRRTSPIASFVADPVSGEFPSLPRISVVAGEGAIESRWQEVLNDVAMAMSPKSAWLVFSRLRLSDDASEIFVTSGEILDEYLYWATTDPNRGSGYALVEALRDSGRMVPLIPDTVRRQEAYVRALRSIWRKVLRLRTVHLRDVESEAHVRVALRTMCCAHIAALVTNVLGVPNATTVANPSRLAAFLARPQQRSAAMHAPELAAFFEVESFKGLFDDDQWHALAGACHGLIRR